MKRNRWLAVAAVALAVSVPSGAGPAGPAQAGEFQELVLAQAVSDNLALLFQQFSTELVLCLEGEERDGKLHIDDFRMPHILMSETGRVQATGCPNQAETVGTWHNHPAPTTSLAGAGGLERNCYLSNTDIRDFLRRDDAYVSVVSCGARIYAYWWRSDVEELAGEVALLPPPTGQLVTAPNAGRSETSRLRQAR